MRCKSIQLSKHYTWDQVSPNISPAGRYINCGSAKHNTTGVLIRFNFFSLSLCNIYVFTNNIYIVYIFCMGFVWQITFSGIYHFIHDIFSANIFFIKQLDKWVCFLYFKPCIFASSSFFITHRLVPVCPQIISNLMAGIHKWSSKNWMYSINFTCPTSKLSTIQSRLHER